MTMIGRQVTLEGLEEHLRGLRGRFLEGHTVTELILHHTWSPTAAQYKGLDTWEAIRAYHMRERGWRDIGYHLGIGPKEEGVWLLRPMTMIGGHCTGHNSKSIGIAMVGNFDKEDPELCLPQAVRVLAVCCRVLGLGPEDIYFHRDFANKTCPGTKISRADVRASVEQLLKTAPSTPKKPGKLQVVRVIDDNRTEAIPCNPKVEGDVVRCDLRALAEALGYVVTDHIKDQGIVYISRRG